MLYALHHNILWALIFHGIMGTYFSAQISNHSTKVAISTPSGPAKFIIIICHSKKKGEEKHHPFKTFQFPMLLLMISSTPPRWLFSFHWVGPLQNIHHQPPISISDEATAVSLTLCEYFWGFTARHSLLFAPRKTNILIDLICFFFLFTRIWSSGNNLQQKNIILLNFASSDEINQK